jgi:hypothetical protein
MHALLRDMLMHDIQKGTALGVVLVDILDISTTALMSVCYFENIIRVEALSRDRKCYNIGLVDNTQIEDHLESCTRT